MISLPFSCGYVVDNCVAPHMLLCIRLSYLEAAFANNDTNFLQSHRRNDQLKSWKLAGALLITSLTPS